MIRSDFYTLRHGIQQCSKFKGRNFQYALAKNLKLINEEIEAMENKYEPSEEYTEYDKERLKLVEEYSQKDPSGNLISNNGRAMFVDDAGRAKFNEALEKLQAKPKYKKAIADFDKLQETQKEFLMSKVPENNLPNWVKIKQDDLPEDVTGDIRFIEMFLD